MADQQIQANNDANDSGVFCEALTIAGVVVAGAALLYGGKKLLKGFDVDTYMDKMSKPTPKSGYVGNKYIPNSKDSDYVKFKKKNIVTPKRTGGVGIDGSYEPLGGAIKKDNTYHPLVRKL